MMPPLSSYTLNTKRANLVHGYASIALMPFPISPYLPRAIMTLLHQAMKLSVTTQRKVQIPLRANCRIHNLRVKSPRLYASTQLSLSRAAWTNYHIPTYQLHPCFLRLQTKVLLKNNGWLLVRCLVYHAVLCRQVTSYWCTTTNSRSYGSRKPVIYH